MKNKTGHKIFAAFLLLLFLAHNSLSTTNANSIQPQQGVTIDQAVLNEISTNGTSTYWIEFDNNVDLSPAYFLNWSDRGWFVYKTLKDHADKTQSQAIAYLQKTGAHYESYWLTNRILVIDSNLTTFSASLQFHDVVSITAPKEYSLHQTESNEISTEITSVGSNIAQVQAPAAWALGIDGRGLVVANIDTGVRHTHEALVGTYRGTNGDGTYTHDYNWFNPEDLNDNVPRDGQGHGTHTMGTMVGDDGGSNQIGVAPGALWIACAGCPDGKCSDYALLACGQWIVAPTDLSGESPNPDMRPNVVNNSWGDCERDYDDWYEDVINAWHAAGVYAVFSNGNNSNCGYPAPPELNTVGNPARSGNVTGVGSSGNSNGQYATHSNWGPTDNPDTINPTYGFDMLKPQVIAPGVNIRSSTPSSDNAYQAGWTGTSMSAPHVSGLVALIMQAGPCLIGNYAVVENLIESTATAITYDDGSPLTPTNYPNFATGWGEINALAAVEGAMNICFDYGSLTGIITEDGTTPVHRARIQVEDSSGFSRITYSKADGSYEISLPEGIFHVTVTKTCHQPTTTSNIMIEAQTPTIQNFVITPLHCYFLFPVFK